MDLNDVEWSQAGAIQNYRITAQWDERVFQSDRISLAAQSVPLVGAPPNVETTVRVSAYSTEQSSWRESTITAGVLSDHVRSMFRCSVIHSFRIFHGTVFSDPTHLVILDRDGRIVWE